MSKRDRLIFGALIVVTLAVLVVLVDAAVSSAAQRQSCPEGWGDVWASGGFSDGRQAVVTGDSLEAWNFFESESDGNLYADGILLGPAPGPNDGRAAYDLPSEGTWTISADGRVSVCVRAHTSITITTTTSTTIPEEPTTTTSTVVPNETTTTTVATTTTVPPVTSSTVPPISDVPGTSTTTPSTGSSTTATSTTSPPLTTPSVPPATPTEPPPPELPATGVSLGWVAAVGTILLGVGVALEAWQRRRQRG